MSSRIPNCFFCSTNGTYVVLYEIDPPGGRGARVFGAGGNGRGRFLGVPISEKLSSAACGCVSESLLSGGVVEVLEFSKDLVRVVPAINRGFKDVVDLTGDHNPVPEPLAFPSVCSGASLLILDPESCINIESDSKSVLFCETGSGVVDRSVVGAGEEVETGPTGCAAIAAVL